MRIASLAEVKAKLSAFLDEVGTTGPVVITRNGRAVAILLAPTDDDDLERLLLSRSPRFRFVLSKSRAAVRAGRGVAHGQFWEAAGRRARRSAESGGKSSGGTAAQQPPARGGGRDHGGAQRSGKARARRR
ncbi:MAG: type II toxin-antitoxin system Phd/YefM family antitoxin [Planctomycetes bacterium]|nr:type II toxin-antitoxin system Phd/YefM family antitoxin [Planctomycetota bacterium]